ncbi:MAG: maleylacetoacetate isomerase [Pseudomonadales bacterium]|jgi:maleylacetoacetate isomerase|nr:maleylacetoacetate isomerase [Pseudomonadales bacterium]
MKPDERDQLTLYSYWRSSAAYRVRIALHLKELIFRTVPVNLLRQGGEQHSEAYRAINPQGLVPALVHEGNVIPQSMAICEYLDECFETNPLLPSDPLGRARIRSLVAQIACDIHPLNNLRVQKCLKGQCGDVVDPVAWMLHWMEEGFEAIERQLEDRSYNQSGYYGDHPGLFECFLIPQVYNAERYGTDMSAYPVISDIVSQCRLEPAFIKAAPENQLDKEPV